MRIFNIACFNGDGIGPEIMAEAVKALDAVSTKVGGFQCEFTTLPAGAQHYLETGEVFPDTSRDAAYTADAIFLSSMGLPNVTKRDGTELQGDIIVLTRRELDLYRGVRPSKLRPNVPSPLKNTGKGIDLLVLREQSEGLFAAYQSSHIVKDQVYSDSMIVTRRGTERIASAAFEYAAAREGAPADRRSRVTCVDKANNFQAMAFFRKVFDEIAESPAHRTIDTEHAYVDAIMIHLLQRPDTFDVLVLENMYGDIVSDLTATLTGGMGFAASADIGDDHAMFQCAGGSAPDIAGQNKANPVAQILSGAMMLEWLGKRHAVPEARRAALLLDKVVDSVLASGHLTNDAGGQTRCSEFGDLVASAVNNL